MHISYISISYQLCNLHAEEDGEGVAYQPGDAKPKQGQPLLPAAKAFNEIQCRISYHIISLNAAMKICEIKHSFRVESDNMTIKNKNGNRKRPFKEHFGFHQKVKILPIFLHLLLGIGDPPPPLRLPKFPKLPFFSPE